jgi:hypothetical protein
MQQEDERVVLLTESDPLFFLARTFPAGANCLSRRPASSYVLLITLYFLEAISKTLRACLTASGSRLGRQAAFATPQRGRFATKWPPCGESGRFAAAELPACAPQGTAAGRADATYLKYVNF